MPPRPDLKARLAGGALIAAHNRVSLAALACGNPLSAPLPSLAGKHVLLRTRDQLHAALALVALDGMAARLVLSPPDLNEDHLPGLIAQAGIDTLVTDGAGVDEYASLQRGWKRSSGTPQFFFPAARLMERVLYGYDLRDLRPVDAMKRIPPRPVLLIYGLLELPTDSDRRPQIKAALPDAELWVVPDAMHTSAYTKVPQPYLAKVGAFFEKNLK